MELNRESIFTDLRESRLETIKKYHLRVLEKSTVFNFESTEQIRINRSDILEPYILSVSFNTTGEKYRGRFKSYRVSDQRSVLVLPESFFRKDHNVIFLEDDGSIGIVIFYDEPVKPGCFIRYYQIKKSRGYNGKTIEIPC